MKRKRNCFCFITKQIGTNKKIRKGNLNVGEINYTFLCVDVLLDHDIKNIEKVSMRKFTTPSEPEYKFV